MSNDFFSQIRSEFHEELNLKKYSKNITLVGFYLDFNQNLLDFVFKINLKNFAKLKNIIAKSEEHSKLLIKNKNYLKKIIKLLKNNFKKIIFKIFK